MYRFTTTGDDDIVEREIDQILRSIAGDESIESLVLFGAYGRGEGLILEGKIRNDLDLLVVGGSDDAIKKLHNANVSTNVDIMYVPTIKDLQGPACTQQLFEIKHASMILSGKPLDLPDWKPYDIMWEDSLQSFERRAVSMMIAKWELGKENPDRRKISEQIIKGIIAVGDAILIKRGQFHPKYAMRALMLSSDAIAPLYIMAVATKLTGMPEYIPDKQWELWHQAREIMRQYCVDNQVKLQNCELLFALTDRTERKDLEEMIKKLGGEKYL